MKVKLSDLYDIGSSKRVFQSEWRDSGVPFYRAREIAKLSSDGTVDNELFIDEELYSEYIEKYGKPEAGDVMVTGVGTLGVCYVVKPDDRFYFKDGNILWFKQKAKDKILPEYLVKAFDSKEVKDFIDKNSSGTTVGTFTIQTAKKMEISLPSLGEQREIIDKVTKIETIIKQRKQELQLLDDLIKARFVEMFGTLDNPADEFEKATLKELCNKITDGKHGGCTSEEGTQRYFVGAREIYDDEVHYDTAPEINVEEFEKDYKRCNIEIGDFLIVNTGATIGKSAIAFDERTEHTLLQKSVALLKVKKDKLNPVFLKWCYRVNTRMYMVESASAQPNLLLSKIKGTVIYVPSIALQNQFADFVRAVDKSKVAVQKALDETQILFDSLMQKYFG